MLAGGRTAGLFSLDCGCAGIGVLKVCVCVFESMELCVYVSVQAYVCVSLFSLLSPSLGNNPSFFPLRGAHTPHTSGDAST